MVQPGANMKADDGCLPPGCVPVFEIEESVRRLVWQSMDRIPTKLSGNRPASSWEQSPNEVLARRLGDVPNLGVLISGIVTYLMERLFWPDRTSSVKNPIGRTAQSIVQNGYQPLDGLRPGLVTTEAGHKEEAEPDPAPSLISLFHKGKLHSFCPDDVMYVCDPAVAPKRCKNKADALGFSEFHANRLNRHPFIDRNSWTILTAPRFHLAGSEAEEEEMRVVWSRLSNFAGATLVISEPSGRSNRQWKAASEIFRGIKGRIKPDLDAILDATLPRRGTPLFEEKVQAARIFYSALRAEQKRTFRLENLAVLFEVHGNPRNCRPLEAIWVAFLKLLPEDEAQRLQKGGRPPKQL